MFKNQLQELAQRSGDNLPSYACIREGPDHAPRFKATVMFNGEAFESPDFRSTLRQAEHAAAEVALNSLSERGQSLAAKILDDAGVCKCLLQEMAQRACISLPSYTTIRFGPGHLPMFQSTVEIAGQCFKGEPAKTKKQAEKNAATVAYATLKQLASQVCSSSESPGSVSNEEQGQIVVGNALLSEHKGHMVSNDRGHMASTVQSRRIPAGSTTSKLRIIPLLESSGQTCTTIQEPCDSSCVTSVANSEGRQKQTLGYHKDNVFKATVSSNHSIIPHTHDLIRGIDEDDASSSPREANTCKNIVTYRSGEIVSPMRKQWSIKPGIEMRIVPFPDDRDDKGFLPGEASTIFVSSEKYDVNSKDGLLSTMQVSYNPISWTPINHCSNAETQRGYHPSKTFRAASSLAPSVKVRQMVPVYSAPPPPSESEDQEHGFKEEAGIQKAFSQLQL